MFPKGMADTLASKTIVISNVKWRIIQRKSGRNVQNFGAFLLCKHYQIEVLIKRIVVQ